jgi:hypothetical protein
MTEAKPQTALQPEESDGEFLAAARAIFFRVSDPNFHGTPTARWITLENSRARLKIIPASLHQGFRAALR